MRTIEADGLVKRYKRQVALSHVSFTVERGEVVVLGGPNGAGKTTTVGLLMGFLEAQAGEARVLGQPALERRHLDRVGWMPENPRFPGRKRIAELTRFQRASFPTWDPELAEALLERLELDPTKRARELSRGQAARVALLLALAHRPELLLLDDPTLGLDPAGRRLLLAEVMAMSAEMGTSVFLTTHLLAEVDLAMDRLLILRGGILEVDEPVESLKERCRRLRLPSSAPEPPPELGVVRTPDGTFATHWNRQAWDQYSHEAGLGAEAEILGVEDIFVLLTGEKA